MGTWGVGIFEDDLAADVRGDWREAVADGADPADATAKLEAAFTAAVADPDDSIVFWLALAAAQAETGGLLDSVRDRAVGLIDRGGDVARWAQEDDDLAREREQVLADLRATLTGPPPAPTPVEPPALAVAFEL